MNVALPLVALAGLLLAAFYWTQSQTLAKQIKELSGKLAEVEVSGREIKEASQQRSQKEKNRTSELDELREKHRDLRRKLGESQETAKRLEQVDELRRSAEGNARDQVLHARSEAQEAARQLQSLRLEVEQLRSRRPAVRFAEVAPAPVPEAAPADLATPRSGELQDLEAKLREERARAQEQEARAKSEQRKAVDAAREADRLKAKVATSEKLYLVQRGELELWKDRYRTLEQRLNRTLREVDALHRGVLALERRLPQASVEAARAEAAVQEPIRPEVESSASQVAAVEGREPLPATGELPGSVSAPAPGSDGAPPAPETPLGSAAEIVPVA